MKKLLVTGTSGFLGWYVTQHLQTTWKIIGTYQRNRFSSDKIETMLRLDLKDTSLLRRCIEHAKPDAILHLAALSSPNSCELQPDLSYRINVVGSLSLAEICEKKSIPMIFVSTDLVFDGKKAPYTEIDDTNAICVYGQHKSQVEKEILTKYPNVAIARLPLMFGLPKWGSNFLVDWLQALQNGKQIRCFVDEYRTANSGRSIAEGLFLLLQQQEKGIFHFGSNERLSRYEFALKVAEVFNMDKNLILPIKQADIEMPAPRPHDVSLQNEKMIQLGYHVSNVIDELKFLKQ